MVYHSTLGWRVKNKKKVQGSNLRGVVRLGMAREPGLGRRDGHGAAVLEVVLLLPHVVVVLVLGPVRVYLRISIN